MTYLPLIAVGTETDRSILSVFTLSILAWISTLTVVQGELTEFACSTGVFASALSLWEKETV